MALMITYNEHSVMPERCPWNQQGECLHPLRAAMVRPLACGYKRTAKVYAYAPDTCPLYADPISCELENVRMGEP